MLATTSDTVLHSLDDGGVLTLTLHRPERHNAWTWELESTLHDLLLQAAASTEVRAIVLTGASRSFCPGLDAIELEKVSQADGVLPQDGRRKIILPALIPKPVVCAINGACAGLGLITALACDVRFAAEGAKITTSFPRRGLPSEEAVSWLLPRIVGHAGALDLLLSGRVVLGSEAATLGLVTRAVAADDLLGVALDYARDLAANCSPLAMATAKRQVYLDWDRGVEESRRHARRLIGELKDRSGDFREGVASYVERRAPAFEALSVTVDPADVSA